MKKHCASYLTKYNFSAKKKRKITEPLNAYLGNGKNFCFFEVSTGRYLQVKLSGGNGVPVSNSSLAESAATSDE